MSFRRLKLPFTEVDWCGMNIKWPEVILVNGSSHYGLVKVASSYKPTEYAQRLPDANLMREILEATEEISAKEIRKLRHHFTRRIWMWDGVFECINWRVLNKEPQPKKPKLLPPIMCYTCMIEGNKYIPKQLKRDSIGLCRCCGTKSTVLHRTRLGWPVDLRHKGFGFTVIGEGRNYTSNVEYYRHNFDMSIFGDYQG